MKKALLALALCVPLMGCAGLASHFAGFDVTASIANPVTPERLYKVEQGARIATAGLLTYRRLCILKKIDRSCRDVIASIQPFTRDLREELPKLRAFVRANDQVNAITTFNAALAILNDIRTRRAASNIDAVVGVKS